jgi:hypothetical protein
MANDDLVTTVLKKKYFELLSQENFPSTPDLTTQIDQLEDEIKRRVSANK